MYCFQVGCLLWQIFSDIAGIRWSLCEIIWFLWWLFLQKKPLELGMALGQSELQAGEGVNVGFVPPKRQVPNMFISRFGGYYGELFWVSLSTSFRLLPISTIIIESQFGGVSKARCSMFFPLCFVSIWDLFLQSQGIILGIVLGHLWVYVVK